MGLRLKDREKQGSEQVWPPPPVKAPESGEWTLRRRRKSPAIKVGLGFAYVLGGLMLVYPEVFASAGLPVRTPDVAALASEMAEAKAVTIYSVEPMPLKEEGGKWHNTVDKSVFTSPPRIDDFLLKSSRTLPKSQQTELMEAVRGGFFGYRDGTPIAFVPTFAL